jgi:hypothetical protein
MSPRGSTSREVFVSYRHLDDAPPPGSPKDRGFVAYLLRQLRWELSQLGVPDALLWHDRSRIEPGDIWSDAIFQALNRAEFFVAILSCNYITSSWCKEELCTMSSRVAELDADVSQARIFRIDKNSVPESDIPEALRRIEPVLFYSADDGIGEFYWRGKVRLTEEYEDALNRLARAIRKQLKDEGVQIGDPVESRPRSTSNTAVNGRVVFVAKPTSDMLEPYRALVWELRGRGYHVTPEDSKALIGPSEEARSTIVRALDDAEISIHFLGQRKGGGLDGPDEALVRMQLTAAADETRNKLNFMRIIWAPKVLMSQTDGEIARDPLDVVSHFGERLDTDQIVGDTASRFTDYVLQRLEQLGKIHSGHRRGEENIRLDAPQ